MPHCVLRGLAKPYDLDLNSDDIPDSIPNFKEQLFHEFEWAFGDEAQARIDKYTNDILHNAKNSQLDESALNKLTNLWSGLGQFDEDILLESLELHLSELSTNTGIDEESLAKRIEERREAIYQFVKVQDDEAVDKLLDIRSEHMHRLHSENPDLYDKMHNYHLEHIEHHEKADN